jgi:hypothetical protein
LEYDCHDWSTLQAFRTLDARRLFDTLLGSSDDAEWDQTLYLLEAYSSNLLGTPSEATKDVVACLVATAVRMDGSRRLSILQLLDELTCGRGIDQYSTQQQIWLVRAVEELSNALHTWTHWAESSSMDDAVMCVQLLSYCAVYVPRLEQRITRYLVLCATARPELSEDISAVVANQKIAAERRKSWPESARE